MERQPCPNAEIAVEDINLTHRGPAQHTDKNALLVKAEIIIRLFADHQTEEDYRHADFEDTADQIEDPTGDHSRPTGVEAPGVVEILDKDEAVVDVVTGTTSNKAQSEQSLPAPVMAQTMRSKTK